MKRIDGMVAEDMRRERETGMTLRDLAAKHGVSKSSVSNIVRGCDDSKVMRAAPNRRVVEDVVAKKRPELSKADIGEAARQMVCARMMLNGVKVFRPLTEDTPIDLLVLRKNGEVVRCQCKYIFPSRFGRHEMVLYAVRKNGPASTALRHRYSLDEVDCFVGYCYDNDGVYVIPNVDTNGVTRLVFWVLREAVGGNGGGLDVGKYLNVFDFLK